MVVIFQAVNIWFLFLHLCAINLLVVDVSSVLFANLFYILAVFCYHLLYFYFNGLDDRELSIYSMCIC